MQSPLISLYVAVLFVALTPGVLLTLPNGGSKLTVAVTHGLVFGLVYYLTHKIVGDLVEDMEGFRPRAGRCRTTCY